jgi:hypothetical protein
LTAHVFVDESKKSGFLIAAALVQPEDLQTTRKALRGLCLPNQRRIHFKDEKQARKKKILEVIASTGVTARVYVGPERVRELAARKACLEHLYADLVELGARKLIIEQDESLVEHDRRWLFAAHKALGADLAYDHLRAHEESLLWIADAVAWCWAAKGVWRERARRFVVAEVEVR